MFSLLVAPNTCSKCSKSGIFSVIIVENFADFEQSMVDLDFISECYISFFIRFDHV